MSNSDHKTKRRVKKETNKNGPVQQQRVHGYGKRKVLDKLPKIDYIEFGECLVFGHFSHVYEGVYKKKYPAAIKVIERGSEKLVEKEVSLLNELKGLPHIVQLYEVIHDESTLLVFELLKGMEEDDFYDELSLDRLRFVLRCLFEALDAAHKVGIVHRDVKLGNILIAKDWSDVKLIDWGCGSPIRSELSSKAGSRSIRSIDMLLGNREYGVKGDSWAMGVFIYTILCGGTLPWRRPTSWETVVRMASFVGRTNTLRLAERYNCEVPDDVIEQIKNIEPRRFKSYYAPEMRHLRDDKLIDLMHKLLLIQPEERWGAAQALSHPFFQLDSDEG